MSSTNSSRRASLFTFILSGLIIVAAVWIYVNKQFVLDQMAVWSYTPSAQIVAIDEKVKFTSKGRFIFYATRPSVEEQASFNKECPRQEAGNPILGCYTNNDRIYIYDLTNDQLAGMEEVTAAHEMLHAAWHRMSKNEQDELATNLKAAYEKLNDDSLKRRMEYYERTEPGEVINELHSILGTEVAALGEPLESYYARYFDRTSVLALYAQYNDKYTDLYSKADEMYAKMKALASTIQSQSKAYSQAADQYTRDVAAFNTRAEQNEFASQGQFNAERASLVSRGVSLEQDRTAVNQNIVAYNQYYAEYQAIAKQIEVLNKGLDSFEQLDKAPSV